MKIDLSDVTFFAGAGLVVAGVYYNHGHWSAATAAGVLLVLLALPRVLTK